MTPRPGTSQHADGDGSSASAVAENNLIARLPANELAEFLVRAQKVPIPLREVLFDLNEPFERVLFPITGMGSLVTVLKDGTSLEAMTVGREGFMALPLFHGISVARCKGVCQIEGDFYQMTPDAFRSLLKVAPRLTEALHRYSQFSSEVIAQT